MTLHVIKVLNMYEIRSHYANGTEINLFFLFGPDLAQHSVGNRGDQQEKE